MYRVVIDTNVFIFGLAPHPNQPPRKILNAWRNKQFTLITSEQHLQELQQVLLRPKIRTLTSLTTPQVNQFINSIRERSIVTFDELKLTVTKDPEDNKIVACAVEGFATHLVTGNTKHFPKTYQGIKIVTPRQFTDLITHIKVGPSKHKP